MFQSSRDLDPILRMEVLTKLHWLCGRVNDADKRVQDYCATS